MDIGYFLREENMDIGYFLHKKYGYWIFPDIKNMDISYIKNIWILNISWQKEYGYWIFPT